MSSSAKQGIRYAVWVEFDVAPERLEPFVQLVAQNARTSLREEAGCQQFDVLRPEPGGSRIALYEIYADKSSFEIHLASLHYHQFAELAAPMIVGKRVQTFWLD
jgi:(4S)-4-hydroxy-5-phosphonooxypentane-2,3-dione isomerase